MPAEESVRPAARTPEPPPIDRGIFHETWSVVSEVIKSVVRLLRERPAQIIASAFLLIMLYGYHGELDLLHRAMPETYVRPGRGWDDPMRLTRPEGRPQIIPGIPWDQELVSFLGGAFLLVIVPMLIIRFGFKERLSDYGLGLPRTREQRRVGWLGFLAIMVICIGPFYLATFDDFPETGVQRVYPFFRPFTSTGEFLLYELTYIPFFIAIEFIFRGYLLFGLARINDPHASSNGTGAKGPLFFGDYALLISMLSYTAWHLGKPISELWGTALWGLGAGTVALRGGSIWPVVLAHFLLCLFMDWMILRHLGLWG